MKSQWGCGDGDSDISHAFDIGFWYANSPRHLDATRCMQARNLLCTFLRYALPEDIDAVQWIQYEEVEQASQGLTD